MARNLLFSDAMNDNIRQYRKHFSIEQANAMLPLVRAIASDMSTLSREIIERRDRLAHLTSGRSGQATDIYGEELSQIEEELEKDGRRLGEYVEELKKLGVEPKNPPEGLVDFPTIMDGREAFLCWKLNEPEVLYWHELDAGFAGRQSLTADSGANGSGLGSHESA
jgi:hypothetical protein